MTDLSTDALARFEPRVAAIVELSARLCAIPGITVPSTQADLAEVRRTSDLVAARARELGLCVIELAADGDHPYPFLVIGLDDPRDPAFTEAVALIGHLDVVPPSEDGQFDPRLDGMDLYARGAADMKTVVASYLEWLGARRGRDNPPLLLLLSCCEENGSAAPHHSESAMRWLREQGVALRFAIVGERTGELEWMKPEPVIGPICKENRSWRWLRAEGAGGGLATLDAFTEVVRLGREAIHHLNTTATPAEKTARQPGVRSGFVCSFALAGAEPDLPEGTWVEVAQPPGAAIHSASATVADPSLLERLHAVAERARRRFDRVALGGLAVGQDHNFNSVDGSGRLLLVIGAPQEEVRSWVDGLQSEGLSVTLVAPAPLSGPAVLGIDIRELLDHAEGVDRYIETFRARLDGFSLAFPSGRPPWRCPADHPDLVALEAAWEAVVGQPSPDLVKLHGNDGGALAALVLEDDPANAGLAPVVVFGQVGMRPHGKGEFHRCTSIAPYLDVLERWADARAE